MIKLRLCAAVVLLAASSPALAAWDGAGWYLTSMDLDSGDTSYVAGPFSSEGACSSDSRVSEDGYRREYLREDVYSPEHVSRHSIEWLEPAWLDTDSYTTSLFRGPYDAAEQCNSDAESLRQRVRPGKNMSFACQYVTSKMDSLSDSDRDWIEDNNLQH